MCVADVLNLKIKPLASGYHMQWLTGSDSAKSVGSVPP